MGQATNFAVLASEKIIVNDLSGVTGSVGISSADDIENRSLLSIQEGSVQTGVYAANALNDATAAYDRFYGKSTATLPTTFKGDKDGIRPGHYKITGLAGFESVLTLNAEGDPNGMYVFEIDGDLISKAPNAAIRLVYAQSKNVYWLVTGRVELGGITNFVGTILAKGDVYLEDGVGVNGRAISLGGTVTLDRNNLYLPGIVRTDVKVVKTAPDQLYRLGDEITYTIAVTNSGPGTAFDVSVLDELPLTGLQYVAGSAAFDGSSSSFDPAALRWSIPELGFAEKKEITLTFRITATGAITNVATAASRDPDPREEDNRSIWTIQVPELNADLSITKTAATAPYTVGGEVTYTVTVKNNGLYEAKGVVMTDALPDGLTFVSSSEGSYNAATGKLVIGTMAAGAEKTITLKASINKAGTLVNTASVVSSPEVPDTNLDNNNATAVIDVGCVELTGLALTGNLNLCEATAGAEYIATEIPGAVYKFTTTGGVQVVSSVGNKAVVAIGATSGTLAVIVTDPCGGRNTSALNIGVIPNISGVTVAGPGEVCANSTDIKFTAPAYEGNITYRWIASGGLTITSATNEAEVKVKAGAVGGVLTLEVNNGCSVVTGTKNVKVRPTLVGPTAITGEAVVCAGTRQTYTAAGDVGASSYTWRLPDGWELAPGTAADQQEINVIVGTAGGEIQVIANNECGTSDTGAAITVAVNNKPDLPTITGQRGACVGEILTYSVLDVADATDYSWNVPETWGLISGANTRSINVRVGPGTGEVTVAVTNGCGTGQTAEMEVAPTLAPAAPVISGTTDVCEGSQGLVYTITNPEAGVTYSWALPQGWSFANNNSTGTSVTVTAGSAGGSITVEGTNSCDTAEGQPLQVNVSAPPVAPGQITDKSNVCEGLVFAIDPVQGAESYTWAVPSGFTITSGQGTTTITVKADKADATGRVTVVATNGPCSSIEASATIDASKADGNLEFPKAFSPNGDGIRDTWEIKNLEKFPVNEVVIFNRWGSEVFRTKGYQNNWSGNKLEQGTYFYKVRVTVCDGVVKEFTGYTTLFR